MMITITKYIMNMVIVLVLCLGFSHSVLAEDGLKNVGSFTKKEMPLWKEKTFKGHTKYQSITDGKNFVLKAECDGTASAFYRDMNIDLTKTPILHWSWKVNNIHDGLDDISKGGDDYAARIYVVYKGGMMPWNVKALNYVWANTQQLQSSWPNAFTKKARMIAQRSGTPKDKSIWLEETRNIREDFSKYFDIDVKKISGVALMSDCDNAGGKATSYYRNIRFTAE